MTPTTGHILVVDDNKLNRMLLQRMLTNRGHSVSEAEDGLKALYTLESPEGAAIDVILLDIMMPELDGYQLLERIKANPKLRHIPVLMTSALDELDSVVRCIEVGATDYLTKPIQPALLQARLNASLAEKRLRDLELEYLEQVGHVVSAAESVESSTYAPASLEQVAARTDALGNLARVFQRMAREVHLREQRLKQQLAQLKLDIEEMQKALTEPLHVYIPMDRRQALVRGETLPDRTHGAALFADISGFTPLTAALSHELGRARGAEEITRLINQIYAALIEDVHFYGGSVIGFSGDAITCWFDGDDGLRAIACGVFMQVSLSQLTTVIGASSLEVKPAIKVAVSAGPARRFLVGDPEIQYLEALAGRTLETLAAAEKLSAPGEVIIPEALARRFANELEVADWRTYTGTGARFAVIAKLTTSVPPAPWPDLTEGAITEEMARPWLLPAVYKLVRTSTKQFLSELRPAAALFLQFRGLDYDNEPDAGARLDAFTRWVQGVMAKYDAALLQLTFGDKGSYLYAAFGAPTAHRNDAARAVEAALELQRPPAHLDFITGIQIGVSQGQMRAGAYGSSERRTYGVLGESVNMAARLMQAAADGILCDEAIFQLAGTRFSFEELPTIRLKGSDDPVKVYRPQSAATPSGKSSPNAVKTLMDVLSPAEQLTLKIASILGLNFEFGALAAIHPGGITDEALANNLEALTQFEFLQRSMDAIIFEFYNDVTHEAAYDSMLFAQRRQLHRQAAEWHEQQHAQDIEPYLETLGTHWKMAEEFSRAVHYLERAAELARQAGEHEKAERLFRECLALNANAAVLSAEYYEEEGG